MGSCQGNESFESHVVDQTLELVTRLKLNLGHAQEMLDRYLWTLTANNHTVSLVAPLLCLASMCSVQTIKAIELATTDQNSESFETGHKLHDCDPECPLSPLLCPITVSGSIR